MKRSTFWSAPTDWETVCKRNAGRRHYNAWRKFKAAYRRHVLVIEAADRLGLSLWAWGTCARIARELNVSRSTVCRDLQAIKAEVRREKACPVCGHSL